MNRNTACTIARQELDKWALPHWGVRLTNSDKARFLGICSYRDSCIILNAHHIDINPDDEIINTIRHEVAHALTPGHNHDEVWKDKCKEVGARPIECSHLDLPAHIIDAIRSSATIEMEVEEHIIRIPKFKITQLQDKCPECGAVAKEKFSFTTTDKEGNTIKLITLECFHITKKVIPRGTPFEKMVSNDWKDEVKNCFHKWTKNQCDLCGEYRLFNFQITGARFAESALSMQKGAGIFDDMGLGKTVQALAILKYHSDKYCPALIVTKSSIKFQWFKQVVRWLGPNYMSQVISTARDYLYPNLKTYIIPYDLLRRFPREKLYKLGIKLVILDECQQIKNPDSSRTKEVRELVSNNSETKVLPLSGTPWKNRSGEFFPVLNMVDPIKFYSYQHYLDNWVGYYFDGAKRKMGGIKNPAKFREFTESLLIRREYNEVMDEFPEINRTKLSFQLDELSQTTYDESVSDFVSWYNQFVIGGEEDTISSIEILARMARMRHITGLAKIPATLSFIEQFIEETDRKLVVFVHHKDVGDLLNSALLNIEDKDWGFLAKELKSNGYKVLKYTSELGDSERFTMQEEFNKSPKAIMIASTLACGEGVDLQTCADSILHERQWNPQNEDQATPGRFRRIGQTAKSINITVPEGEDTIDQQLDTIIERKRRQFHEVMNKGEQPVWNEGEFAKELAESIVTKHRIKNSGKTTRFSITAVAQPTW